MLVEVFGDDFAGTGTLFAADKGIVGDIRDLDLVPFRDLVIRWTDQHELIVPAHRDHQVLIGHRGLHDPDVDLIVLNHVHDAHGVGYLQAQLDVGKLVLELTEQRGDAILGDGGTGTDHQHPDDIAGESTHLVVHLVVQADDPFGVDVDLLAGFGEADLVVGAVEQAGVEILFQLPDLEGHRRLGHVQRLRGLGKTQ